MIQPVLSKRGFVGAAATLSWAERLPAQRRINPTASTIAPGLRALWRWRARLIEISCWVVSFKQRKGLARRSRMRSASIICSWVCIIRHREGWSTCAGFSL
jgi:hypothetical protein